MNPSHYRERWASWLRKGASEEAVEQLARQVAFSFIDHCRYGDHYEPEYIDLLCEMATGSTQPGWNALASSALFGVVIEELCDDYEDFQFETYARVMTQIITRCRQLREGRWFDDRLNDFGLQGPQDVLGRALEVHRTPFAWDRSQRVDRIFVLSRITIGADVAIVSVLVQRLLSHFPEAQIILLGGPKIREIFAGSPRIQVREIRYARRGGILERFAAWQGALDILAGESSLESDGRTWIVDPDSRIAQLGMLPLSQGVEDYLYFDSHRGPRGLRGVSMAQLANEWMDEVFAESQFSYPRVWLSSEDSGNARRLVQGLRDRGCRRVVTVNFGVGGNGRKRLGLDFERKLTLRLLKAAHTFVILDMGSGREEWSASQEILESCRRAGHEAILFQAGSVWDASLAHGVLGIECTIGQMAGLMKESDEYIGYDSAGQHIAAALGVPTLTLFAGTNNPRFIRRWSASGQPHPKIIHVNTLMHGPPSDIDGVVDRIMQEREP